jgi:hypothetical protein
MTMENPRLVKYKSRVKKSNYAQQHHPQGMGVSLHTFGDVPGQAVPVKKIIHRSESNVRIVTQPARAE